MERIKNFFGFGEDLGDEDDIYESEPIVAVEPQEDRSQSVERSQRPRTTTKPALNIHSNSNVQMKICIHEPLSYDEAPLIVDDLRLRKAVVLNFEQLDMNIKRQIFDFVNGSLYALDGKIQKVNKDIFILAPSNIEIEGLKAELQEKGVFPW
ncbi:MAG: cell division protein SepF [Tissierellia bacterium]|nr:cell division protein SepF [Tissierellia bacterium]